jgi:hypothetical protein
LKRTDTLWKALGKASVLAAAVPDLLLVLLTTDLPVEGSAGATALAAVRGPETNKSVKDVIRLLDPSDLKRLAQYANGE